MRGAALLLASALALSGCVAYPRPYFTLVRGRAALDDGKPLRIQAAIIKNCDTIQGESEDIVRRRETITGKDGRYSIFLYGVVWHLKNFINLSECSSHIQRFVCRPHCKKADEVDIDVLGK